MKRVVIMAMLALLVACAGGGEGSDKENEAKELTVEQGKAKMLNDIATMETDLTSNLDVTKPLQKNKAEDLLRKYRDYANINPRDSITPHYLLKAADLSIGLGKFDHAVGYLENVLKNHPTYEKRIEAMLLKGFVLEYHMNQHAQAVSAYKELIHAYPNHRLAKDAQASIENLTLTEDQLIEKLKKAQKQ
jgi:TolA-binding protein